MRVRIWSSGVNDKEGMNNLQDQVETELARSHKDKVKATWLQSSAGGDNASKTVLTVIVETRI